MKVVAVGPDTRIPGSLNAAPKTVLLLEFQRIHDGLETVDYYPNVFENFSTRLVTENGSQADLNLWDTQGQQGYERLRPLSYPNTDVFLLCFSLIDKSTLDDVLTTYVPELGLHAPNARIILIGFCPEDRDARLQAKKDVDSCTSGVKLLASCKQLLTSKFRYSHTKVS